MTFEIAGKQRSRFIWTIVLLFLLDPVRGEPTAYGLDQEEDLGTSKDHRLKRNFLDSFALICAIKKDGDSVSAATMEEGSSEGTVIRIASNAGVSKDTLSNVQELVDILNAVPGKGVIATEEKEIDVLLRIIRLDINKIREYLETLRAAKTPFKESSASIESRLSESFTQSEIGDFLTWFENIFELQSLPQEPTPEDIFEHVRWAQVAKRHYSKFLGHAFPPKDNLLPKWIRTIFKLGRYGIASRVFIETARKLPSLFRPMTVQALPPPPMSEWIESGDETPLTTTLRKIVGHKTEKIKTQLAGIWGTGDLEDSFRQAFPSAPVVHAEMQLLNFYNDNPQLKPSFQFIGVSKKSCYLCYNFLEACSNPFHVSSCHQKLYIKWKPPPAIDNEIYSRYKEVIRKMTEDMEKTAKDDLEHRLDASRRPVHPDSTAGVSLTGFTVLREQDEDIQGQVESENNSIASGILVGPSGASQTGSYPTEMITLSPQSPKAEKTDSRELWIQSSVERTAERDQSRSISSMAFHFTRPGDIQKQEIMRICDILDNSTNSPSWTKLLAILKADDCLSIGFREGIDVMMVNNRIRVANERQFLACLVYLYNSGIYSSEVLVYGVQELTGSAQYI